MRAWLSQVARRLVERPSLNVLVILVTTSLQVVGVPTIWLVGLLVALMVLSRQSAIWALVAFLAAVLPGWCAWLLTEDAVRSLALTFAGINHSLLYLMIVGLACLWRRLRAYEPAMELVALMTGSAILLMHVLYPDLSSWWWSQLSALIGATSPAGVTEGDADFIRQATQTMAGYIAISSLVMANLVLWLTVRWLALADCVPASTPWTQPMLYRFRLSWFYTGVLILGFALAFWVVPVADAMTVLWLVPMMAGLSLLKGALIRSKHPRGYSVAVVFLMVFLMNVSFFLVACLGVLDRFLDLRDRFQVFSDCSDSGFKKSGQKPKI